jgi:hypothetical protein
MNTRRFVSGSSIILAGWLGATFLNDVPETKYPKLDKKPESASLPDDGEKVMVARQQQNPATAGSAWH